MARGIVEKFDDATKTTVLMVEPIRQIEAMVIRKLKQPIR
jgi:hypothetical protein